MYISDPKLFAYGVAEPIGAIGTLTATTLRNIVGSMELDDTLSSRDIINAKMTSALDAATDPWGIKVTRVEIKNIIPPDSIREAMEKQMRAEREKRESITNAEAKKRSDILTAEGEKEAAILRAEADKETAILAAQAERQKLIEEAEGRAQALKAVKEAEAAGILMTKNAEADGIKLIKAAQADDRVVALKSLETLATVANGRATKLIIPSEIQNVAGLIASLKGVSDSVDESIDVSDIEKKVNDLKASTSEADSFENSDAVGTKKDPFR